jgi:hypothetical protein
LIIFAKAHDIIILKLLQKLQPPISIPWWIVTTKSTLKHLTYYNIHLTPHI